MPGGVLPSFPGRHPSATPKEPSWRWWVRLQRVQPAGWGVGLGIEAAFELLAQLHTGGLLDMGVGVHQHIRTGVTCGPLHRLDVAAGDHQLVGGTGID